MPQRTAEPPHLKHILEIPFRPVQTGASLRRPLPPKSKRCGQPLRQDHQQSVPHPFPSSSVCCNLISPTHQRTTSLLALSPQSKCYSELSFSMVQHSPLQRVTGAFQRGGGHARWHELAGQLSAAAQQAHLQALCCEAARSDCPDICSNISVISHHQYSGSLHSSRQHLELSLWLSFGAGLAPGGSRQKLQIALQTPDVMGALLGFRRVLCQWSIIQHHHGCTASGDLFGSCTHSSKFSAWQAIDHENYRCCCQMSIQ